MRAYITSVGERTTNLCRWTLERNGFDVTTLDNPKTSLAQKLMWIYNATLGIDFLRVDADVIINRNMTPDRLKELSRLNPDIWWWQFVTFDWYKQDTACQMSFIRKEARPHLTKNIVRFLDHLRPETEMSRIKEFYEPRRFETYDDMLMGIHGYGIKDLGPVKQLKTERGQLQLYDFELAERLNEL